MNPLVSLLCIWVLIFFYFIGALFFDTPLFTVAFSGTVWILLGFCQIILFLVVLSFIFNIRHHSRLRLLCGFSYIPLLGIALWFNKKHGLFDVTELRKKLGVQPESAIPLSDLENLPPAKDDVSWIDFLPAVSNQGVCASCWAHASATVLSSKINIDTSKELVSKPRVVSCISPENLQFSHVSAQQLIDLDSVREEGVKVFGKCYSSAATAGFRIAQKVSIMDPFCYPNGSNLSPRCDNSCFNSDRSTKTKTTFCTTDNIKEVKVCPNSAAQKTNTVRSKNLRFFRGEENIRKEISANGPVACLINFYTKRNGSLPIWTLTERNKPIVVPDGFIVKPEMDGDEYTKEPRDGFHMVTVYGYGDNGVDKYWNIRNSWGTEWGVNGSVRMQRGVDAWGIESVACYTADAVLEKNISDSAS